MSVTTVAKVGSPKIRLKINQSNQESETDQNYSRYNNWLNSEIWNDESRNTGSYRSYNRNWIDINFQITAQEIK